jgi:hypothetical protein
MLSFLVSQMVVGFSDIRNHVLLTHRFGNDISVKDMIMGLINQARNYRTPLRTMRRIQNGSLGTHPRIGCSIISSQEMQECVYQMVQFLRPASTPLLFREYLKHTQ